MATSVAETTYSSIKIGGGGGQEGRLIGNPVVIGGIPLPSDAPLFLAFIGLHVAAGLVCVIAGVIAMLSRKQHGRHPQAGTIYYCALAVVFITMTVLSISRWADDYHLFMLGACRSLPRRLDERREEGFGPLGREFI